MLEENLKRLRDRIIRSADKVGKNPEEITIVAVSKGILPEFLRKVFDLGIKDIGENRVQEAKEKFHNLKDLNITWHMVGHLQTNKVKYALDIFDYIHSLDSLKLAKELQKRCVQKNKKMNVFIEVNVSGEKTKFGVSPFEIEELVTEVLKLSHLNFIGFMTVAPMVNDSEDTRFYFKNLREIRDSISQKINKKLYLSMGMSDDFEVAIEEGADFIRIGRALFGGKI